jgi:carboxyl-terminal processing protease
MNQSSRYISRKRRDAPARRITASIRSATIVLLFVAVSACTTPVATPPAGLKAHGEVAVMLSAVLEFVSDIYIDDTSVEALALAGLQKLNRIEPAATIERDEKNVRLLINGTTVAIAATPHRNDPKGWGTSMALLVEDGRSASNLLKATDNEKLFKTIIDGMLSGLDRYSRYAGAEAARIQREQREGFGGVGISIVGDELGARVQHITEGMPADRGGILAGDVIAAANGMSLRNKTLSDIVELLRGPVGSKIALTIRREGRPDPIDIVLERERVIPLTVTYERRGGFSYLHMTGFNQDTTRELMDAVTRSQREIGAALQGIVIDLRGNPGGLLDQAVDSADLFLMRGRISTTEGRHPDSQQVFDATRSTVGDGIPLAILIDGSSASASEVLAAALQDQGRAVLIGSRSFGKGTVQTVLRLPNDGELILTWAKLLAPSGYVLKKLGVLPTICTSDSNDPAVALKLAIDAGEARRQLQLRRNADAGGPASLNAAEMLCPWRPRDGVDIDIGVAKRLLETPGLYQKALQAASYNAGS